jgi:glycosyltransferase involved in cell wall biosynthesis
MDESQLEPRALEGNAPLNRPLRFLHVTSFYPPYAFGGDAMYLYRLCHQLGEAGHEVDVVHCVDSYRILHPAEPEVQFSEHPRVHRHELRSPFGRFAPLVSHQTGYPLLQQGKIQELLRQRAYDVIHFHNASLFGPGVLDIEAQHGSPVRFYTAHEHWLVCPTHVLWKFNERLCEKPECLKCVLLAKRPPQLWRYTDLLERKSEAIDQFFSPSEFSARMHAERGFKRPLECLPYFLAPADRDWQQPVERLHQRPYFLFVGRLEYIKGVQELIALWNQIPGHDLLIAGSGTRAEDLRLQAAGNPRIRFLGPQTQLQLGGLYYHAVACLVPSITYETFGIVAIEAFARKTPVIVHDLGGLAEVVEKSSGGLTYKTREELLAGIKQLGSAPGCRNELGEKGYQAFLRNWTPEAHLKLYYGWIERVRQNRSKTMTMSDTG